MERGKKLFKNSVVLMIGSILTKGLNFIMAPLFTRWLSTADYGTFDLLATYVTLLIPILAMGVHHALFRFLLDDISTDNKNKVVTNSLIINFIGILIYLIFVIIIGSLNHSLTNYILILSGLLFAQTIQNYMGMYIRGIKQLKLYTEANVFCTASILLFVFVFVRIIGLGLTGMALGYIAGYLLSSIFAIYKTKAYRYIRKESCDKSQIVEMLKYSIPMVPNSIAWWVVNISDRMIVSFVLGVSANAILAVAHKIPNLCTTVYDVFQTAWVENATEAIKDSDWDSYFSKMLNTMGQFCISVSMLIITTNFFLFDMLFTDDYHIGKYLTPIFAVAVIFAALSQCIGSVFVAEYDSKKQGITMLEAGMINILFHLLFIKYIGIFASAVSTLIAYVFLFYIRYSSVKNKYRINIERKTIVLISILLCFMAFSYIESDIINISMLVLSIIITTLANKEIISLILKRYILSR